MPPKGARLNEFKLFVPAAGLICKGVCFVINLRSIIQQNDEKVFTIGSDSFIDNCSALVGLFDANIIKQFHFFISFL